MPANGWAVSELVPQGLSVKPMDSATESKPPDLLFHQNLGLPSFDWQVR